MLDSERIRPAFVTKESEELEQFLRIHEPGSTPSMLPKGRADTAPTMLSFSRTRHVEIPWRSLAKSISEEALATGHALRQVLEETWGRRPYEVPIPEGMFARAEDGQFVTWVHADAAADPEKVEVPAGEIIAVLRVGQERSDENEYVWLHIERDQTADFWGEEAAYEHAWGVVESTQSVWLSSTDYAPTSTEREEPDLARWNVSREFLDSVPPLFEQTREGAYKYWLFVKSSREALRGGIVGDDLITGLGDDSDLPDPPPTRIVKTWFGVPKREEFIDETRSRLEIAWGLDEQGRADANSLVTTVGDDGVRAHWIRSIDAPFEMAAGRWKIQPLKGDDVLLKDTASGRLWHPVARDGEGPITVEHFTTSRSEYERTWARRIDRLELVWVVPGEVALNDESASHGPRPRSSTCTFNRFSASTLS